jgi:predicted ATPase
MTHLLNASWKPNAEAARQSEAFPFTVPAAGNDFWKSRPPPERVDEWRGSVHADEVAAAEFLARYDGRSHGESFLDLFGARLGDGLYLLDEPETPLSPHRQLTLLALLGDATKRGAQFVVATHSPILLAFPGARIYDFDALPVRATTYDALPHVTLTRDFLNAPERYVRHLAG